MKTNAYAFEQIKVENEPVGLSEQLASNTSDHKPVLAHITVEGSAIRFRYDGGAPSKGVGHLVNVYGTIKLEGQQALQKFRAISTNNAPAHLSVTYEGE